MQNSQFAEQVRQQITALLLECPELAEDEVLRADMIEGETDAKECLRKLERQRQDTLGLIKGLAIVIEDLHARRGRFERREEAMRRLMHKVLDAADLPKMELPEATLSIRKGTPKVIITEQNDIPDYYIRIKKEPDRTLIGAALKAGSSVPGAVLSNAEPHLSIRTR